MHRAVQRYLAGAAAAAIVVLAGLVAWALFGPGTPPRRAVDPTGQPAAARIAEYGRTVQRAAGGVTYVATEEQQARPGQGYRVTFASAEPARADGAAGADSADSAANARRQADWQKTFCSQALQDEMRAGRVEVVTGRVVDGAGRTQYVADCLAGGAQQKMGRGGPLL